MWESWLSDSGIFKAAVSLPVDRRATFVAQACGGNQELLGEVESLLRAHDASSFLDHLPDRSQAALDRNSVAERPGSIIGAYKLLEQIGEGGFGVVFLAEQQQPVRRRVALKILKAGMDTRQVVARFEAERQALALMDHRHIAKVLDAGATDAGRPYFVMELVHGVPITEYCDHCNLSLRERLELFMAVCQAVQHAHQKGVIHRDIKPTNVLVAIEDDRPSPKVIDFGVAKAINQRLTEQSLETAFTQLIGTPLYMSPEQAELSPLGVDTRTDIYSLGVLLYELLTSTTPFEQQRLHDVSYDELRRIVREEDPPRPSHRVSTLGPRAETAAENRRTDTRRLRQVVRGELDWIVMKALEKDRNRRYDTAAALLQDIERFLMHEPVEAGPPSAMYRFRKFVRRNRGTVVAAILVLLALLTGAAVSTWQAIRAYHAEQNFRIAADSEHKANQAEIAHRKQAEAVSSFLVSAFRSPDPYKDGRTITIAEVLDRAAKDVQERFADDPLTKSALLDAIGASYSSLGLYRAAVPILEDARQLRVGTLGPDHRDSLSTMSALAWAYYKVGRAGEAITLAQETLKRQTSNLGTDDPATLASMNALASIYSTPGIERYDEAITIDEQAFQLTKAKLGPEARETLITMDSLALCYDRAGLTDDAISQEEDTLSRMQIELAPDDPHTLMVMHNLASFYSHARRQQDARRLLVQALPLLERTFKFDKPRLGIDDAVAIGMMSDLARAYYVLGRTDEALQQFHEVVKVRQARLGPDHPDTIASMIDLRNMLSASNSIKYADAESACLEAVQLQPDNAAVQYSLGCVLAHGAKYVEAVEAYREVVRLIPAFGGAHQDLAVALVKEAESAGKTPPWDEVAVEFARAIELTDDTHATLSERKRTCSELAQWGDELFSRVAVLLPKETTLWVGRAHNHVLRGLWKEALFDYAEVIHSRPVQDDTFEFAGLLLLTGDKQAYERFCQEVIARPGEPRDHNAAIIMARLCALGPSEITEPQLAVQWATHGVEVMQRAGFATHVLALAQYRAHQYDLAIHNLQESNAGRDARLLKAANWLLLSMIHCRQAHPEEARQCFEKAHQMIEQLRPKKANDLVAATDWIEVNVLLPEAEALLKEQAQKTKYSTPESK
jgi:eukaryotic-like serine/threonine-protein kinase